MRTRMKILALGAAITPPFFARANGHLVGNEAAETKLDADDRQLQDVTIGLPNTLAPPIFAFGGRECSPDDRNNRVFPKMTSRSDMTYDVCFRWCYEQLDDDFTPNFFALQYGSECWCGQSSSSVSGGSEDAVCDFPCSGDPSETCGGFLAYQAWEYEQANEYDYVGCFRDVGGDRVLDFGYADDDMTIQDCFGHCVTNDYPYFGVQYGRECWCGGCNTFDDYDKHGTAECNTDCAGDSKYVCGGTWAFDLFQVDESFLGDYCPDFDSMADEP